MTKVKKMYPEERVRECIDYFKNEKAFSKLLKLMKERYEALGHIGGTVKLDKLTYEEKEAISSLFLKDYSNNKSVTISLKKFEEALDNTKYKGIGLLTILEGCFGEIVTKKEQKEYKKKKWILYFNQLINIVKNKELKTWIDSQQKTNSHVYKWLRKKYKENSDLLYSQIKALDRIIQTLPYNNNSVEYLSIYAAAVTGDPHGLDEGKDLYRLLIYYLKDLFNLTNILTGEEKIGLLYKAGLVLDSVSNYTACYGLRGYINGKEHKGWEGFFKANEPVNITLWNISHIDRIEARNNTVFLVENPSVFSSITKSMNNISMICTNGQVRYSTYLILDKLHKQNTTMWYSGDFDPEGLLIVDKLLKRYSSLKLWGYSEKNYLKSMSNKEISESRLKQLDNIESNQLNNISAIIKKYKKAGYQESIIEELKKIMTKI